MNLRPYRVDVRRLIAGLMLTAATAAQAGLLVMDPPVLRLTPTDVVLPAGPPGGLGAYLPGPGNIDVPVTVRVPEILGVTGPRPPKWEELVGSYIDARPGLTDMGLGFYVPASADVNALFGAEISHLESRFSGIDFTISVRDPSGLTSCFFSPPGDLGPGINTCVPQPAPVVPATQGLAVFVGGFDWSNFSGNDYIYSFANLGAMLYLDATNLALATGPDGPGLYREPGAPDDPLRTFNVRSFDPRTMAFAGVVEVSAVPEPTSLALLGAGLAALALRRRGRRAAH
ncbi:MAG: PEP-CTERM sorting domain-containing protein [Caldimonas sp.]